ncbi:hypothetical protein L5515_005062 [Caenorhabditis briggsae]|uniref:Histone-lysine N-methyltransferase, H3 lysine-79 specific n=1 Tax=Caenorhabditis briggsae TaxID=6238 RepID=A0AAE9JDP6_CAEBR|nr:hypothetical protein L5515_005062 [Caenorhabditis briggsae]
MTAMFNDNQYEKLANRATVLKKVWVRPRNTGLMSSVGIAPMLGAIEVPEMRLRDARMSNGASVLSHWRANNPTAVVNPDQFMVRELSSGVLIPVQFLKIVQLPRDFTIAENKELIKKATIILANNLLFDDKLMKKLKEILYFCNSGTRIVVTKLIDRTRMKEDNFSEHFNSYSGTVPLEGIDRQMEWTKKDIPFWLTTMDQDKVFRVAEKYRAEKEEREERREVKRLTRAQKAEMRNVGRLLHE